ncbi:hypothetical protein HOE04_01910 [archaeon]|mgnify:CR=1 FL=1|jgi:hypothetical protein|nr:hypothetical protein [archaeon]
MYNYSYKHLRDGGHSKHKYETILTATFSFGQEIHPDQREEVRERYNTTTKTTAEKEMLCHARRELGKYLFEMEDLEFSDVKITPFRFKTGFRLRQKVGGYLPLEKMIDLEALNEFVLTGKTKQAEIQKALVEQLA